MEATNLTEPWKNTKEFQQYQAVANTVLNDKNATPEQKQAAKSSQEGYEKDQLALYNANQKKIEETNKKAVTDRASFEKNKSYVTNYDDVISKYDGVVSDRVALLKTSPN